MRKIEQEHEKTARHAAQVREALASRSGLERVLVGWIDAKAAALTGGCFASPDELSTGPTIQSDFHAREK